MKLIKFTDLFIKLHNFNNVWRCKDIIKLKDNFILKED